MDNLLYLCGADNKTLNIRKRYLCLRRSLLIIMLLITLIPLSITAGLSYYQYRELTQKESSNNIRWHAESARRSLEVFLDGLKDSMAVIANTYSVKELAQQKKMDEIFADMKSKHQGLVDLSLIGPNGIQVAYAGPYGLAGKDYSKSPWYHRTLVNKVYISEVFMGYRNIPHFVVAVSKRAPDGPDYWVIRASIDTDTLDQYLTSIGTELVDDIFLVNQEGILQSTSRFYGKVSEQFPLLQAPGTKSVSVSEARRKNHTALQAIVGSVQGTPWILVVEQKDYRERSSWLSFKNQLLAIFIITAMFASLIIIKIAKSMASKVRDADETRETLLKETEHTNKLASIGRLAAGVAHEINNPLAIINEKAGLMKDLLGLSKDFKYSEKFLQQLTSLEGAVKRAQVITHRLLGFARRMDVPFGPVQVNDVLQEVIGFLNKEALYRDIRFDLALQDDLPQIQSDQGQLQQIFLNIINNAIDAIGKNGLIQISTQEINHMTIQIDIGDSGPGMPEDILKNIFEPFFTTKKESANPGTGLGLAITYGLVKKMGGRITVSSTVGIGTAFHLTFPITHTHTQEEQS